MTKPIEHCYWVVQNKLLAGEYPRTKEAGPSQRRIDALVRAGVTLFIDLTEENEDLLPYASFLTAHKRVSHRRFPIRDVSIPRSQEVTIGILNAIDAETSKGGIVYVHCWGGVGRTGLIVGCWLARHCGDGNAALLRLRELWQHCPKSLDRQSPETIDQEHYIINWKEARKI
jgi:protein tyrosine/serine phosphatase